MCVHQSIRTSAQSVCALNGGCREESACYYTNCQRTRKRCSRLWKPRSVVLNPALVFHKPVHGGSPDTFIIAKVSTQKKTCASLLLHSVSFLRFSCGVSPSTGRGVIRVSHICAAKIETMKIYSEESGGIFMKFCTSENFPLYSKCCRI